MDGNKVLPMEIIYRSLRLHGGGFRKGTHHQQNQQQAGREEERKRGSQVHPCPVAVEDVHGFLWCALAVFWVNLSRTTTTVSYRNVRSWRWPHNRRRTAAMVVVVASSILLRLLLLLLCVCNHAVQPASSSWRTLSQVMMRRGCFQIAHAGTPSSHGRRWVQSCCGRRRGSSSTGGGGLWRRSGWRGWS